MKRLLNYLTGRSHLLHLLRLEREEHRRTRAAYRQYRDLYLREVAAYRELAAQVAREGA